MENTAVKLTIASESHLDCKRPLRKNTFDLKLNLRSQRPIVSAKAQNVRSFTKLLSYFAEHY